jgi:pilus assembly protein Flp/PilA
MQTVIFENLNKENQKMLDILKTLHKEESGQDLIEYALIAALIAVACITAMKGVATAINNEFNKVTTNLT